MTFRVTIDRQVVATVELRLDINDKLIDIVSNVSRGQINIKLGTIENRLQLNHRNVRDHVDIMPINHRIQFITRFDDELMRNVKTLPDDIPFSFEWIS